MIDDHYIRFGLTQKQYELIVKELVAMPDIEKVLIFGSRATGIFKPSSDIDLAIFGINISYALINKLYSALDDLPLPYMFDVINYDDILNNKLKEKIDRQGQLFFERKLQKAI